MKVTLVNSNFGSLEESTIMPLTMYYIGGLLRDSGHDITIIDSMIYAYRKVGDGYINKLASAAQSSNVMAFTVNTFDWAVVISDIMRIREEGFEGIIIVGGVHPSLAYKHIIKKYGDYIDYIMLGDAEHNLCPLLDALENKKPTDNVPGIVYMRDNKIIYNEPILSPKLMKHAHIPAYDLMPDKVYKSVTLECSRGCMGRCSFCSIPFKRRWRGHTLEYLDSVLDELILHLGKLTGNPSIVTTDDCFTTDPERAIDILRKFIDYGMQDYEILIEARIMDLKNERLLEMISRFPNMNIQIGVESGYAEGLKAIRKPVTMESLYKCSDDLIKFGINKKVFYSFIVGMPHETVEQCYMTIDTIKDLQNNYGISTNVSIWLPLPSESFELLKEMVPEIDYSIYDEIGWYNSRPLFYKCHPKLSKKDSAMLHQEIYNIDTKRV